MLARGTCADCGKAIAPDSPATVCDVATGQPVYFCDPCWRRGFRSHSGHDHLAVLAALQEQYDREAAARHRRIVEVLA